MFVGLYMQNTYKLQEVESGERGGDNFCLKSFNTLIYNI